MTETLHNLVKSVNGVLWGNLMTYFLLGIGVLYTLVLKFPQIRHFGHMWKVVFGGRKRNTEGEAGISSFQALCTSLAAQVGTGNIAGVATAVASGGPGAVFWMWVTALIGMATINAEAILGQLYRVRDEEGQLRGGPAYYIERGLGWRWLGVLFSISIIFAMPWVFNAVQTNSIVSGVTGAWNVSPHLVGLCVLAFTALVIFGGLKRIARVAEIVVPLMALGYLILALVVVFKNITLMPGVFKTVFSSAFHGVKPVSGGVLGYTIAQAFRYGVARGLFSNEAGMGSTPNANAVADVRHPARQGVSAMMGVFTDTIIICTCTAFIVLLSHSKGTPDLTGVQLTQFALSSEIGVWGSRFIAIALIFFAWTSILGNYYYGETNLLNLMDNKGVLLIFRLIVLGFIYFGAVNSVPLVWDMADMFNGIMAFINLFALLLLVVVVYKVSHDYTLARRMGDEDPWFDREAVKFRFANVELPERK